MPSTGKFYRKIWSAMTQPALWRVVISVTVSFITGTLLAIGLFLVWTAVVFFAWIAGMLKGKKN